MRLDLNKREILHKYVKNNVFFGSKVSCCSRSKFIIGIDTCFPGVL